MQSTPYCAANLFRCFFLPLDLDWFHHFLSSNKNVQVSSFKSRENIRKKEGGSDRPVLNNKFSSVTLNELAMKSRENAVASIFQQGSQTKY